MRVILYTFLNLFCLTLAPITESAQAETPEARHQRLRLEQLKNLALEKATEDSKGPVSEQKLKGDAGVPPHSLQADSKTEDDGDSDEKDSEGKTGQQDKRNQSGQEPAAKLSTVPKLPQKKMPVQPPPSSMGTAPSLPVKPGTALPTLVFPGK